MQCSKVKGVLDLEEFVAYHNRAMRGRRYPEAIRVHATTLRREGRSLFEISLALGIPKNTAEELGMDHGDGMVAETSPHP